MRKLLPWLLLLSMCFWAGCGGDDDDNGTNGNGGDPVLTKVPVNSTVSAPDMGSVDHSSWDAVTPVGLAVSNAEAPYIKGKVSAFSDSVWVQAIKASGQLFLRLQWDDDDFSIERQQWTIIDTSGFNWTYSPYIPFEDQALVMFDMGDDSTWDSWNWRLLTTGQAEAAEDMTYDAVDDTLTMDAGDPMAWRNLNPGDNARPRWVHKDTSDFTGDVMFLDDTLPATDARFAPYDSGQTVPGWVLVDSVVPVDMQAQSRWDIETVYDYDLVDNRYTLVLARSLSSGTEDLDMSALAEVKTKVGVLDNNPLSQDGSRKLFTEYFLLDF